jgi:hypothetical protein
MYYLFDAFFILLFIFFQYLVGPAIVAATARLHYLQPGENPWLENTVKELAQKSGLPMPRVATVPNNTPNAFTFGRSQGDATLAVHEGLLNNLNEAEVRGVIAHELGHIKHKDYIVMTVLSALPEPQADRAPGHHEALILNTQNSQKMLEDQEPSAGVEVAPDVVAIPGMHPPTTTASAPRSNAFRTKLGSTRPEQGTLTTRTSALCLSLVILSRQTAKKA